MGLASNSSIAFVLALSAIAATSCAHSPAPSAPAMIMVASSAFNDGDTIPDQYTCTGTNVSPPISWGKVPNASRSIVVIVDDPDAPSGDWSHWVVYNIPANTHKLPESVPAEVDLSSGARQGKNDFEKTGYGGPCPPPGSPHHYHFHVYAVDERLSLPDSATMSDVNSAIQNHVVADGELVAVYGR